MRKTIDVIIEDDNRDKGKIFHITEMPAAQAEKWAVRALMVVARSGVDIGAATGMGMQGIAMMGVSAILSASWEEAEPLLDEMMGCIKVKVADEGKPVVVRELFDGDIEEVMTRLKLRQEILELHTGFSIAGVMSKQTSETSASNSSNTKTSAA